MFSTITAGEAHQDHEHDGDGEEADSSSRLALSPVSLHGSAAIPVSHCNALGGGGVLIFLLI